MDEDGLSDATRLEKDNGKASRYLDARKVVQTDGFVRCSISLLLLLFLLTDLDY